MREYKFISAFVRLLSFAIIFGEILQLVPFVTARPSQPQIPTTVNADPIAASEHVNSHNHTTLKANDYEISRTEKQQDWKNDLPLDLQKRRTLYRFFLPTDQARYVQLNNANKNNSTLSDNDGCEVFLLGTSHISSSSCDDVKLLMEYARPDCLFLELCPHRVPILEDPILMPQPILQPNELETASSSNTHTQKQNKRFPFWTKQARKQPKKPSLLQQIQTVQAQSPDMSISSALSTVLLSQIQSDYATKLNITVGAEFREALQIALKLNAQDKSQICRVVLGDRPVHLTLLRTWESLNIFSKIKLVLALLWGCLPFNQPSEKELKEWMDSILLDGGEDILSKGMKELAKHFPSIEKVIIHERDTYMYAKLNQIAQLGAKKIVAVVGAGHCRGICSQVQRYKHGVKIGYLKEESFENILKEIIETNRYNVDEGPDSDAMKHLLTDVIELNVHR